jgi:hypothetical protein
MPSSRRPPAKPAASVKAAPAKTMTIETRGPGKRWGKDFWRSVLENFVLAFGTIFLLQLAQIQKAVSAGDWNTVKKLALAAIFGAAFAFIKALWTMLGIPTNGKAS